MKKLLSLVVCLMAATAMMADNYLKSGDAAVLDNSEITCTLELDFTNANVEGKPYKEYIASRDAEWNRDWPNDLANGMQFFVNKWNKKNKKGMQVTTETGGKYRLVIKPTYIFFGSAALAWTIGFGAGGMKMSGTMEVMDGDKTLLVVDIKDQTGKSKLTETKRFASLMEELADDLYKDSRKWK